MVVRYMLLTNNICLFLALTNVALNKVTKQSSTYVHGNADLAVDGNKNTYFYSESCTHTRTTTSPWWMVDLGQEVTWLNILHSLIVGLYPYHFKVNSL